MSVKGIFTSTPTDPNSDLDVFPFATIVFAIVIGWLLVSIAQRLLENFLFQTLGMNSRSTVHALIVAIAAFLIFLVFVWMVDEFQIIPSSSAASAVEGATEGLINGTQGSSQGTSSSVIGQQLRSGFRKGQPTIIQPVRF